MMFNKLIRMVKKSACKAAVGTALCAAFTSCAAGAHLDLIKQVQDYGTLDNPKYLVRTEPDQTIGSFDYASNEKKIHMTSIETIAGILNQIFYLDNLARGIEKRVNQANQLKIDKHNIEQYAVFMSGTLEAFEHLKKDFREISYSIDGILALDSKLSHLPKRIIKRYREGDCAKEDPTKDIDSILRRLSRKMTDKELPESLKIIYDGTGLPPSIYGEYTLKKESIRIKYMSCSAMVCDGMHEIGHAIAQHDENFLKNSSFRSLPAYSPFRRNIDMMEEASAYGLQILSVYYVDDDNLRKQMIKFMKACRYNNMQYHVTFKNYIHEEAYALADATITYFKDPVKAFNYLATTRYENIKKEIFNIAKENNKVFKTYLEKKDELVRKEGALSGVIRELETSLDVLE